MDTRSGHRSEAEPAFLSSVADDVWHPGRPADTSESWYFDALSDNGQEVVTISFVDPAKPAASNGKAAHLPRPRFDFSYHRGGRSVYRTSALFPPESFEADAAEPFVKIGPNSVTFRSASYGSGFHVQIDAPLWGGRRLRGNFEWLAIESDLAVGNAGGESGVRWNLAAPRCDVTGKVAVSEKNGVDRELFQFRGTGYHDHRIFRTGSGNGAASRWGRAHFADATAVFSGHGADPQQAVLTLVRDSEIEQWTAAVEDQTHARNMLGSKYPTRFRLLAENNIRLKVKPIKAIGSGEIGVRFLSEMTLTLRDGTPRRTTGVIELPVRRPIIRRGLAWLRGMRKTEPGRVR
jgi:hypothetical protein